MKGAQSEVEDSLSSEVRGLILEVRELASEVRGLLSEVGAEVP